jgi:hypothetical protein
MPLLHADALEFVVPSTEILEVKTQSLIQALST